MSKAQIQAAIEKRLREAQAATRRGQYPVAPQRGKEKDWKQQDYYSKTDDDRPSEVFHQFISPDGDLTFERAHVHVIHDERNDEVRLQISLGEKPRHSETIALVGATGSEVNAAIDLLTDALKARMR